MGALEPLSEVGGDLVDTTAKAQLPGAGQAVRQATPAGGGAIAEADAAALAASLPPTEARACEVDGEQVQVQPDEVIITETPREGWSVVNDSGETVALDLEITPELRAGRPGA